MEILQFEAAKRIYRGSQLAPPWISDALLHGLERRNRPLEVDLTHPSWRVEEVVTESMVADPQHTSLALGFAWPNLHAWRLKNVTLDVASSLLFSRDRVIAQSGTGTRSSADSAFISGAYARHRSIDPQRVDHPFSSVGDVQHHYHFMIETLPRMLRIQAIDASTVFYLSDEPSEFAEDVMSSLGFNMAYVEKGTLVTGREILLVDQPLKFWPRKSDVLLVAQSLTTLAAEGAQKGLRNLYVSRRGAERSPREEEFLENALRQEGLVLVRLEDLPMREQLSLVRDSTVLVGLHGAGLASCVMMAAGGALVELSSGDRFEPCYQRMAELIGLDYRYVSLPATAWDPYGVVTDEVVDSVLAAVRGFQPK